MRFINIEFDSSTEMTFMTENTNEEIQLVMEKFEDTEEFISDDYQSDEFVNFCNENGVTLTAVEKGEITLFFDRSKQL